MPSQQQRHSTSQGPSQVQEGGLTAAPSAQDTQGNAALQAQLPQQTSLYAELREKLGDALADAITDKLSEDELFGYVDPFIDDFLAKATEAAQGDPSHGLSEAQVSEAFADLDTKVDAAAKALLQRLDVDGILAGIAKEHTELVALAAVAAAVAWALKTNPDLPSFGKKKDLGGGHSVEGNLDLGRLLDLTLEHIDATWAFDGDKTDASVKVYGGDKDGGWGGEGKLSHALDAGVLGANGRYFRNDDGSQNASGGLSFDGKQTDASLDGKWARDVSGNDTWGLGAALSHDGENTDTSLSGRFDRTASGDTGHIMGRIKHDNDQRHSELGGRYNLDGSWSADGHVSQVDGDKRWKLGADASGETDGDVLATLSGQHSDKHDGFDHSLSGRYSTDGAWKANGSLTGQDTDNPWSLSGQAGRTSLDPEVDWSVTGKFGRQLDEQGLTTVSGLQTIGSDRTASRLQLDQKLATDADHSLSAWVERERTENGVVDGIGGSLNTQLDGADLYAKGWMKSNDTWEASAGISKGTANDDLSWFAEGYTGKNTFGEQDNGVRAGLKWRF